MSGWIKLHRKLMDWEWYQDSNMVHLYLHMLLKANREPRKWKGTWVDRGQFVGGRESLSFETGISVQTIRTCITRLQENGLLTSKPTNTYTLFTLVKWESVVNGDDSINQQANQLLTINQPTTNHQLTTNKKDKKVKNGKKEKKGTNVPKEKAAPSSLDVEFESFWEGCQKKVAKRAAKKAWMKMRKENRTDLSADELLAKYNALVESDMAERGTKEFVPHPSTWINQDRWDDEVIEAPKKYPFNQRVVFMAKDEIHPLNQGLFQWFYDRTWYVNDEKKRVYDESGKYRDDLYVDPEGDIQQW